MKRYLVVFINDGQFQIDMVMANNIIEALSNFKSSGLMYEEIYSIARAA